MIGLLRPFSRDGGLGFAKGDALEGRIGAIMAANGELPWKPQLDSHVDRLRNQRNTPILEQYALVYLSTALGQFEPGVVVRDVSASRDDVSLTLNISYETATGKGTATAKL